MTSKFNFSRTSLIDKYNSIQNDYTPIDIYINKLLEKCKFLYNYDFIYIHKCVGDFPDLRVFPNVRTLFITNSNINVSSHTIPIPDWIKRVSIEFTEINELPVLSTNLTRLYISYCNIRYLPEILPDTLDELILEYNLQLEKLPPLPQNLSKLVCIHSCVEKIPPIVNNLYILYCWSNKLTELPYIPNNNLKYLQCFPNPFTEMPWINELYYSNISNSNLSLKINMHTIFRFRELFYILKFRYKLLQWCWNSRERIAMAVMHPDKVQLFIDNITETTDTDLETALDKFYLEHVK